MELLDDLAARGLIQDTTDRDALRARLAEGPITLYYGCDPTADSLHVGNLIGLIVLRRFAEAGHRPIALAGGATGMVGDPGGRSEERNLLDEPTLRSNVAAIKEQITRVLGGSPFELVDNLDWTKDLTLLDFLRTVGKHVTVNQMMARESVRARLESEHGISFTEFSYMLLQGNDYRVLHETRGCDLQIGGSDQWGNILSGVDLIRRSSGDVVHALCWPLLLAPDGTKLGKTTGARTWLSAARTSYSEFFQHWLHTDDRQVGEFLRKFTLLPLDEIDGIVREHEGAPEKRRGQLALARAVTALVHGDAAVAEAEGSRAAFGSAHDAAGLAALEGVIDTSPLAGDLPRPLVDVLAELGLTKSKGEARRLVEQGGVSLNDEPVRDPASVLVPSSFLDGRLLVGLGKRRRHLVVRRVDEAAGDP